MEVMKMFGFLAKLEALSTSIQDLVSRISTLSNKVEGLLVSLNNEISDDFDSMIFKSVTLSNGDKFEKATVSMENGLLTIESAGKTVVTTERFTAEL